MRILFVVCGLGFGHASRTHKIIGRLVERGHEVYVAASGDALEYYWGVGFKRVVKAPGMIIKWSDSGFSPLYSSLHYISKFGYYRTAIYVERKIIDLINPDLIIIDSKPLSQFSTRVFRDIPRLVLTNQLSVSSNSELLNNLILYKVFPKIWLMSDLVALLDLPPPYTITYRNIIDVISRYGGDLLSKIVFTGPIIEQPSIEVKPGGREWDLGFYISAPYLDKKIFSMEVLKLLNVLRGRYRVRVSLGDPSKKDLFIKGRGLLVNGWIEDKYGFLGSVNVVVLRGGQTSIFESIYSLTPMIVIPAVNQTEQIENAKRVMDLGIGEYIDFNELRRSPKILLNTLRKIFGNYSVYLGNLVNIRRQLIRYNGLDNIVDMVEGMVD